MNYIVDRQGVNLADARLGAEVISVSDEFFAPCERMLNPAPPVFIDGKFDDHGKWMDGWESRRKRVEGFDYCVIRLATRGKVNAVDIDTSHFIGNFPPLASVEACDCGDKNPDENTVWTLVLPQVALSKDSQHLHSVDVKGCFTHVRLNIFPDGGVARLRVYGEPVSEPLTGQQSSIDLASLLNGGKAIACSDQCFGSSMLKLGYPDRGINMGDGWETARRRVPGNEWVILQLARPSLIEEIQLDTAHYKGNYPDRASVQAAYLDLDSSDNRFLGCSLAEEAVNQSMFWPEILAEQTLAADSVCGFKIELADQFPVTHVKVNIIPDGGLSRVRLHGRYADE